MTTTELPVKIGRTATAQERRPIVARLHLRHQKPKAIHQALQAQGISCELSTVCRDIKYLEAQWREELLGNPLEVRAKEWAEIEEAEAECWLQYAQTRDKAWLAELRGWKERKAKLLGLDAPKSLFDGANIDLSDNRSVNVYGDDGLESLLGKLADIAARRGAREDSPGLSAE